MQTGSRVTVRTQVLLPIQLGGFATEARMITFEGLADLREHFALALGPLARHHVVHEDMTPLVRLHSECLTGDVLGSQRCDCGAQLRESLERITSCGGYLLYLRQEGRGIGLYNKIDAYGLQDSGLDTYEANVALGFAHDERDYSVAAEMLCALGVRHVDLLSNNSDKALQLLTAGVSVRTMVPTGWHASPANRKYLAAKAKHEADAASAIVRTTRLESADA